MKFKDYVYQRPNIDEIKAKYGILKDAFQVAKDAPAQIKIIKRVFSLIDEVDTMSQLVSIRYSLDTQDPFYEGEMNFIDEASPHDFRRRIAQHPFGADVKNLDDPLGIGSNARKIGAVEDRPLQGSGLEQSRFARSRGDDFNVSRFVRHGGYLLRTKSYFVPTVFFPRPQYYLKIVFG